MLVRVIADQDNEDGEASASIARAPAACRWEGGRFLSAVCIQTTPLQLSGTDRRCLKKGARIRDGCVVNKYGEGLGELKVGNVEEKRDDDAVRCPGALKS